MELQSQSQSQSQSPSALTCFGTPKVQLISELATLTPITDTGLPEYLIRPDLLPIAASADSITTEVLHAAKIFVSYAQGYPTFAETDQPLWFQASYEPDEAFEAFETYLEQGAQKGFRQLVDPTNLPSDQPSLTEWFYLYYWATRCQAYDAFKQVASSFLMAQRRMDMNEDHYGKGSTLLEQAFSRLQDTDLSAREAVEVGKFAAKLQRDAVTEFQSQSQSKSGINLEIAVGQGNTTTSSARNSRGAALVDKALSDPETARTLQQIIIRLHVDK